MISMQDSFRIRAETGPSLYLTPEKQYSEDFEPYESIDMEVKMSIKLV